MRPIALSAAITAISTLFAGTALAQPAPFSQEPFTDVAKSHANFEAIEYLRTNNIVKGYTNGTFRPSRRITRAEFVALTTNRFFLSARESDCIKTHLSAHESTRVFFTDVAMDAWYAQDVCEAKMHELIHGYADGTFKPLHNITFVEAAKIAARLLALDVAREKPADDKWYVAYVQKLSALNAIPTTIRSLTQPVTRGEMAEILFRLKTNTTTKASARFENLN